MSTISRLMRRAAVAVVQHERAGRGEVLCARLPDREPAHGDAADEHGLRQVDESGDEIGGHRAYAAAASAAAALVSAATTASAKNDPKVRRRLRLSSRFRSARITVIAICGSSTFVQHRSR